jgi:hypothetical protein
MRRRICLVVGLAALAVPASGWAQSSSQAQYQGVAPETQIPVGGPGGTAGSGGVVTSGGGGGSHATGTGRPVSGAGSHPAGGDGTVLTTKKQGGGTTGLSLPSASSSTSPFGGGDIVLIVLAVVGLVALGLVLRRGTRHTPSGA